LGFFVYGFLLKTL